MTLMKLKVAAVALAAGLAVAGAGAVSYRALAAEPAQDQGAAGRVEQIKKQIAELQEELRRAEDAAAHDRAAARQAPVAVIFGDVPITRGELGDHLVRRLSAEQLQQYINLRIIEHAARAKGVTVTDQEVEAACAAERKALAETSEAFEDNLRQYHKTPAEWKEDVIRPRLLLEKLCRGRVRVTEQDLRNAYEAHHGKKVECQVILWPAAEREKAERLYPVLRENEAQFTLAAGTQPTTALARTDGRLPAFGRHSTGNDQLEEAAFRLRPGEVSPLTETPEGLAVVKCLRRFPADRSTRFEDVRAGLKQEVLDRLVQQETVKVFKELKVEARPRVLWTPEGAGQPAVP